MIYTEIVQKVSDFFLFCAQCSNGVDRRLRIYGEQGQTGGSYDNHPGRLQCYELPPRCRAA